MAITGGRISFEQSRKLAEYENRKVLIEFSVTDEQDATQQVIDAGILARAHVFHLLDIPNKSAPLKAEAPKVEETGEKKTRPKKPPPIVVDLKADPAAVAEPQAQISTGNERVDPAAVNDDISIPGFLDRTTKPAAADELDDILGGGPEPITDEALVHAVTAKNAKIKNAPAIRGLSAKFGGGAPKTVRDIPQDKRAAFLAELEGL